MQRNEGSTKLGLRAGRKAGHKNQMIMAPTGAGKSYLGLRIIHKALLHGAADASRGCHNLAVALDGCATASDGLP